MTAHDRYDHMTIAETISLWSDYYGVHFSHEAGRDLAGLLMRSPEAMWRAEYEAERTARLDAEARLRGLRWWLAMVVVLGVAMIALAGCLRGANDMSRAVARWEVRR